MSFQEMLRSRSARIHTDFLLPHVGPDTRLLDLGCGPGSISVGLTNSVRHVVGLDLEKVVFEPAQAHLRKESISNVHLVAGDGGHLPFPSGSFDAVLMHSALEAAQDPALLVREASRVLVPGGVLAAASVEYGGLVLAGPKQDLLKRFYSARERLWALERIARPRSGRDLRRLLHGCGFRDIEATAHYLSYGTPDAVRSFGEARAKDCQDPWFTSGSATHQLLTGEDLLQTRRAWEEWALSPESFLAFAWCRVVGFK